MREAEAAMNDTADWKDYWLKGKENLAALWAHERKQYNVCAVLLGGWESAGGA